MIQASEFFTSEKESKGHAVNFLVELPGLGQWFATLDPNFLAPGWLASDILVASNNVLAGDPLPTWSTDRIDMIRNGGIGQVSYELADDGFARTGNTSINLLNQDLFNVDTLLDFALENAVAHIRMGFGGGPGDYVSIFKGNIDKALSSYGGVQMSFLDETVRNITPVPVQIGADFLPRAFSQNNDAIPIVLGCAEDMPVIQTIGATSATLAFGYDTSDTEIFFFETNATFPASGQIEVVGDAGTETLTYTSVSQRVQSGIFVGVFTVPATPTLTVGSGASITLKNFTPTYTFGFSTQNIRRVRLDGGAPSVAPTVKNQALVTTGGDSRKISIVEFSAEQSGSITATVASEARGPNLVNNGNFDDNVSGWTIGNGTQTWVLPAGTFDRVLELRTNVSQTLQSDTRQDVTVVAGNPHRLTFTFRNVDVAFGLVHVGTPTDSTKYFTFSEMASTAESLFDLTFVPDEDTVRLTLLVDNGGADTETREGYFDQIDMYDLTTENPSVQIQHLINTHMSPLEPDPASFATSQGVWALSRDRCAGVIQEAEEPQGLLGRIAEQFRAKTFLDENGRQHMVTFDQSAIPKRDFTSKDIKRGTFTVSTTPVSQVFTHYNVYWGRAPLVSEADKLGGRAAFAGLAFANPEETNSTLDSGLVTLCANAKRDFRKTATKDVFADLIPDVRTAENLLSHICRKGTHTRRIITFTTWLRASLLQVADTVTVAHDLLGTGAHIFEITKKRLVPNGCEVLFEMEEVLPFRFGSYTEGWEPDTDIAVIRRLEPWEPPAPPEVLVRDCNPFVERWELDGAAYIPLLHRGASAWRDGPAATPALLDRLMGGASGAPATEAQFRGTTFSPRNDGAEMHPNVGDDTFGETASFGAATIGPSFKAYAFPNSGFSITANQWGTNGDALHLRPTFQEFFKIFGGVAGSQPESDSIRAENYEFSTDFISTISRVGMTHDLSFRIVVKLNNKNESYPIWVGYDQDPFLADITQVPFAIWYDKTADRFAFGVSNNVPGAGSSSDTRIASLTQRVLANTLGSPSTGTFYQLLCTWSDATNTCTIKVDNTAVDSAAITPDYVMDRAHVGLIGGWTFSLTGVQFSALVGSDTALTKTRLTLDGSVGLFSWWARVVNSAEGDELWNAGTPQHFGPSGTL